MPPLVLYFGGGILGVVTVLMVVSVLTLAGHVYVSGQLLPNLFSGTIDREFIRPLLRFGGVLAVSAVASVVLANLEKLILARVTSVEDLAYYSVAFMLVSIAPLFAAAMVQSLIPAFSQLLGPESQTEMTVLFTRAMRINVLGVIPILVSLFVLARPFFASWAGEEFGNKSTPAFYILIVGVFFNILAYVPGGLLLASGRSDFYAKLYWLELVPYLLLIILLTSRFAIIGAAAAWTIKMCLDSVLIAAFAKRVAGVPFKIFESIGKVLILVLGIFLLPVVVTLLLPDSPGWPAVMLLFSLLAYSFLTWKHFLTDEERGWLQFRLRALRSQ